jgi:hypothetical protein
MNSSVRASVTSARRPWLGLAMFLVGGCASQASVARDAFVASYLCPSHQVSVRGVRGGPSGDVHLVEVTGCGHDVQYSCQLISGPVICDPALTNPADCGDHNVCTPSSGATPPTPAPTAR